MELAPGDQIDRFRIDAKIRSNALATVLRVRDLEDGTPYALKVLFLDRPTLQDRILVDGGAQSRLRHPNVVGLVDVLDVGGNPGLLMEYVNGPTLERVLAGPRLDLDLVRANVPGILAGVRAAHRARIVHRDLKPGNILFDIVGETMTPRITDFGLAQLLGQHRSGITASGVTLTTPNYMSPEQIRNARSADARSDLFALGAILYELVTGQRAFRNENVFAILSDITDGNYVAVRELRPDTPARFVEAIAAAMELHVDDRVADCDELWGLWAGPAASDLDEAAARPVPLVHRIAEGASPEPKARSDRRPVGDRAAEPPRALAFGAILLGALAVLVLFAVVLALLALLR